MEEKKELPLDRFMQAFPNLVDVFSHSRLIKITISMVRSNTGSGSFHQTEELPLNHYIHMCPIRAQL